MKTEQYPSSELLINEDGSIFHLHLKPEHLSEKIVMMGDPERVSMVGTLMDKIEVNIQNREFHTITGNYKGKRITAISHGIGTDNIDIVVNELDALANIDLNSRTDKSNHTTLTMVRIGTCGGLQDDLPVGTFLASERSIGFDGVLNFYKGRDLVSDLDFEQTFVLQTGYAPSWARPYVVLSNKSLLEQIAKNDMKRGVTISANGFYGPQGRRLRIALAEPRLNERIEAFSYKGERITNYEMESSALAGLSALLDHRALTVCLVIANRRALSVEINYKERMKELLVTVLDRI